LGGLHHSITLWQRDARTGCLVDVFGNGPIPLLGELTERIQLEGVVLVIGTDAGVDRRTGFLIGWSSKRNK
jgi:hypothetical protein